MIPCFVTSKKTFNINLTIEQQFGTLFVYYMIPQIAFTVKLFLDRHTICYEGTLFIEKTTYESRLSTNDRSNTTAKLSLVFTFFDCISLADITLFDK